MKTSAIIRIIIWTIVLVILVSMLAGGLLLRSYRTNFFTEEYALPVEENNNQTLPESGSGSTGRSFQVPAGNITGLKIEWVAGDITIFAKEGIDQIYVREDAVSDSRYVMQYRQSGSTLKIQFCKEAKISFGTDVSFTKDLTIEVPASWVCRELELDVAAANLEVRNLSIGEVDFDGASGTCDFVDCAVGEMDMDTASGDVTFSGTLNSLDFDAASASFTGVFQNTPREIDMDGMSGELDITLPEDTGFTARLEGLNSTLRTEVPDVDYWGDAYVYGDGRCQIQVNGMSWDVTIRQPDTVIGGTLPPAES